MDCSLEVLISSGSPGRYLLALLADRGCTLSYLLHCFKKIDHREAVEFLTKHGTQFLYIHTFYLTKLITTRMFFFFTAMEHINITLHPQSQRVPEGNPVVLCCKAVGPLDLTYQWFKGGDEVW